MTLYQLLPALTPEDYAALREDIKAHGVRVPVDVDENGQVLDGHHRSLIAAELGIDCPRRVLTGLAEAEKVAHALAVNVHRRSLSREQKRHLLAASIKAEPDASDREHARRLGVSKNTAAAVREEMEATGQVDQLDSRRGADGRTRPSSQPPRPQSSPSFVTATALGEGASDGDPGHVPIAQHPDYAALDRGLDEVLDATDDRFRLSLARAVSAAQPLLALDAERIAQTCPPGSTDRRVLDGFLARLDDWVRAVRTQDSPALRRIK